jgi:hypothetical protein
MAEIFTQEALAQAGHELWKNKNAEPACKLLEGVGSMTERRAILLQALSASEDHRTVTNNGDGAGTLLSRDGFWIGGLISDQKGSNWSWRKLDLEQFKGGSSSLAMFVLGPHEGASSIVFRDIFDKGELTRSTCDKLTS